MNENNYMEMLEEENRRLLEELDNANDTVEYLKKEREVLIKQIEELVEVKNKKSEIIKKHFEKLGDIKKQIDESLNPIKGYIEDKEDKGDNIEDKDDRAEDVLDIINQIRQDIRECTDEQEKYERHLQRTIEAVFPDK